MEQPRNVQNARQQRPAEAKNTKVMQNMLAVVQLVGILFMIRMLIGHDCPQVRQGAKQVFLISVLLFTIGSVLCAFAGSIEQLIFFRVLQGLGA